MTGDLLPPADHLATLPRKRVITSALITDSHGCVLCVEPTYKPTWHLPGGTVEQGESPAEACARECLEELGVPAQIGRLLAVGHLPPQGTDPHGALAFLYDAALAPGATERIRPAPEELHQVLFLDTQARARKLSELAQSFVAAGLGALEAGTTIEIDRSPGTAR